MHRGQCCPDQERVAGAGRGVWATAASRSQHEQLRAAPPASMLALGPLPLCIPHLPSSLLDSSAPDGQEAVCSPRGEHGEVSLPGFGQPQPQHPLVQEWARVPGGAPHRGHPGKGQVPPLQPSLPGSGPPITPRCLFSSLCSSGTSTGAW